MNVQTPESPKIRIKELWLTKRKIDSLATVNKRDPVEVRGDFERSSTTEVTELYLLMNSFIGSFIDNLAYLGYVS